MSALRDGESGGCGADGCYVCWDGDHLSKSAYEALRRVEVMLTEAVERTPIDWDKIRKVPADYLITGSVEVP